MYCICILWILTCTVNIWIKCVCMIFSYLLVIISCDDNEKLRLWVYDLTSRKSLHQWVGGGTVRAWCEDSKGWECVACELSLVFFQNYIPWHLVFKRWHVSPVKNYCKKWGRNLKRCAWACVSNMLPETCCLPLLLTLRKTAASIPELSEEVLIFF